MRPTRVSFSAIQTYEECPASYSYAYIEQLPDPSGDAAARGQRLHLSGELYLKGRLPEEKLPVDYWRVKEQMKEFKKAKAKAEETWCVDRNWKVCTEVDEAIWFKAIVDIHYVKSRELHVTDLKTGKIYPSHAEQLQLYATLGLIVYPKVKIVHVSGLYLDQGRVDSVSSYPRSMLKHLVAYWEEKAQTIMKDEEFIPKPSESNCKWCAFNAKRGGPCLSGV